MTFSFSCLPLIIIIQAFGINGSKTILSKDTNLEFLMGNRGGLSFYDAKIACIGYSCSGKTHTLTLLFQHFNFY
jgi:hypothetical protein